MKPLRVGLVGLGIFFQKKHWPTLLRMSDSFVVTAVVTSQDVKFDQIKKKYAKAKRFRDAESLFANDVCDAVIACVPIPEHDRMVRLAVKSNKSLLIEKPLSHSLSAATEVLDLIKAQETRVMVAESYRYFGFIDQIHQDLSRKRFGSLLRVEVQSVVMLDQSNPYSQTAWRQRPDRYAGILWDGGIHFVSLLTGLFDSVSIKNPTLVSVNPQLGLYDTLSADLVLNDGVPGRLMLSYSLPAVSAPLIRLYCQQGVIDGHYSGVTYHTQQGSKIVPDKKDVYENIYQEFYDWLNNQAQPRYSVQAAYDDLCLLNSVLIQTDRVPGEA